MVLVGSVWAIDTSEYRSEGVERMVQEELWAVCFREEWSLSHTDATKESKVLQEAVQSVVAFAVRRAGNVSDGGDQYWFTGRHFIVREKEIWGGPGIVWKLCLSWTFKSLTLWFMQHRDGSQYTWCLTRPGTGRCPTERVWWIFWMMPRWTWIFLQKDFRNEVYRNNVHMHGQMIFQVFLTPEGTQDLKGGDHVRLKE